VLTRLEGEFFERLPWQQALNEQQRASLLSLLATVLNSGQVADEPPAAAGAPGRPEGAVAPAR
jgi:hypothetical protein